MKMRGEGGSGAAEVLALPMVGLLLMLSLGRIPTGRLPQVVKGGDVLSVAFGDARAVIAQMMIRKSDSYYHGGIDIECPEHGDDGDCHHDEDHCTAHANTQTCKHADKDFPDPWNWINARIRAPQQHIHLDGERAVELLPFYWVALRANPHDVEAWTTAIFIASSQLNDDDLAKRLIAETKERNPLSAEVAFAEGRYLRKNGKGDLLAAKKCFERAERLLKQKGVDKWTEDDRLLANLIKTFLTSAKETSFLQKQ